MKFFSQYFKEILNRPHIKFILNLFFFRNTEKIKLKHILIPQLYVNNKNLTIKFLKNNIIYSNLYIVIIFVILFILIIF